MFARLVKKEILENLLSIRFIAGLAFVLVLFTSTTLIYCRKYESRIEYVRYTHRLQEDAIAASALAGSESLYSTRIALAKGVRLTSFFASGDENRYPQAATTSAAVIPRSGFFSGLDVNAQQLNYKLERYQDYDLAYIVGVVLSFLCLVLSYDAISRDREQGTLRQQLANSVPRTTIMLSKYTAVMVILFVAVFLGSMCSAVILQILLSRNLFFSFPTESLLNGLLAMMYLSVFAWGALWFSAAFSKPATSLSLLLVVWVVLVVLSPFVGNMFVQRLKPIETQSEFENRFQSLMSEFLYKAPKEVRHAIEGSMDVADWNIVQKYFDDEATIMEAYYGNRLNEMMAQDEFAQSLSFFSPYGAYRLAVEQLSNAGLPYHRKFIEAVKQYRNTLREFVRAQDAQDPASKHRMIWFPGMAALSRRPLDVLSVPRFEPPRAAVTLGDIEAALPSVGYLLFLNVVFFFLSLGTFARADIR